MILGIDPGISGAIACVVEGTGRVQWVEDMPTFSVVVAGARRNRVDALGLASILRRDLFGISLAVVENVHALPQEGVTSAFGFGRSLGIIEGVLATLGIGIEFVQPERWKKHYGLLRSEKDASRLRALQDAPHLADALRLKKHHGRADSILIARYGAQVIAREWERQAA